MTDSASQFIDSLIETADKDDWDRTDSGFQLVGRAYTAKIRRTGGVFELAVESADGDEILHARQRTGGEYDEITGKLAFLVQELQKEDRVSEAKLENVLRDLRSRR